MEDPGQIIIELAPLEGGRKTALWMSGKLPTAMPSKPLRRAIRLISGWSFMPVAVVFCADDLHGGWHDSWTEILGGMKEHHLELHTSRWAPEYDRWSK